MKFRVDINGDAVYIVDCDDKDTAKIEAIKSYISSITVRPATQHEEHVYTQHGGVILHVPEIVK